LPVAAALRALCHGDASQEQQSLDVVDEIFESQIQLKSDLALETEQVTTLKHCRPA
jgi:hypothetical protein